MANNSSLPRATFGEILAHLHSLRASLTKARDALVHFKADRIDRDKLEPAARRVDDLMNLFAHGSRNAEQGLRFITEVESGIRQVTNSKSADALRDAHVDIAALIGLITPALPRPPDRPDRESSTPPDAGANAAP